MRGKPNVYHAQPVTLWGQVVYYEVLVNHVPVCRVVPEREGLKIIDKVTTLKLNPELVRLACNERI
jgi:hypothetical protein